MSATHDDARRRRPIIAANWKMNLRGGEPARYFETFLAAGPPPPDRDVAFFVPAVLLPEAAQACRGTVLAVGVQNIHWEDQGPFTGEISGPMAASVGAARCLVGHSERRQLFGEDDESVARKLRAALRSALAPLVCVGERLDDRRAGRAESTVVGQLERGLAALDIAQLGQIAVAYEPVWAIGTGETATPEIAAAMHATLRAALERLGGAGVAARTRILYGGSVTPENIAGLMAEPGIDGVLVGGASLDPLAFRRIVEGG